MPSSETLDRTPPPTTTTATTLFATKTSAHMAEQEPLRCPRCDSTNTKFCYYNNYNFSQPRHFCKSCRRYWTHGGTLRDIPVGGGSRRNAKRSRTLTTTSAAVPSPIPSTPLFVSLSNAAAAMGRGGGPYVGEVLMKQQPSGAGSFTSLLNAAGPGGLLALGGFGLGLGRSGLEDVGFGLGRGMWAFPDVGCLGGGGGGRAAGGGSDSGGWNATWLLDRGGGEDLFDGDQCFSAPPLWPELAISTPGNGLK
ncbi:hypothetical protein Drorol1_Dr00010678 [Drosera rotundifolia]